MLPFRKKKQAPAVASAAHTAVNDKLDAVNARLEETCRDMHKRLEEKPRRQRPALAVVK